MLSSSNLIVQVVKCEVQAQVQDACKNVYSTYERCTVQDHTNNDLYATFLSRDVENACASAWALGS